VKTIDEIVYILCSAMCAAYFSVWQQSVSAGFFAFTLLVTIGLLRRRKH